MRKRSKRNQAPALPAEEVPGSFGAPASGGAPSFFESPVHSESPAPSGTPGFSGTPGQAYDGGASYDDATPETIVVRVRRHGRHLTPAIVLLFVVAAAAGYFIGWFPEIWMNIAAASVAGLLVIFGGIGPILGWLSHRAVVTTRRVILHRGFFVRHRTEVSLGRVREVKSKQNPIQRMWASGDIDLYVGAEATRIGDVPRVHDLHAALQELAERNYDEQLRWATRF